MVRTEKSKVVNDDAETREKKNEGKIRKRRKKGRGCET